MPQAGDGDMKRGGCRRQGCEGGEKSAAAPLSLPVILSEAKDLLHPFWRLTQEPQGQ
jgi:hypothetical protein